MPGIISFVPDVIRVLMVCIMFVSNIAVGGQSNSNPSILITQSLSNLGPGIITLMCGCGFFVLIVANMKMPPTY